MTSTDNTSSVPRLLGLISDTTYGAFPGGEWTHPAYLSGRKAKAHAVGADGTAACGQTPDRGEDWQTGPDLYRKGCRVCYPEGPRYPLAALGPLA